MSVGNTTLGLGTTCLAHCMDFCSNTSSPSQVNLHSVRKEVAIQFQSICLSWNTCPYLWCNSIDAHFQGAYLEDKHNNFLVLLQPLSRQVAACVLCWKMLPKWHVLSNKKHCHHLHRGSNAGRHSLCTARRAAQHSHSLSTATHSHAQQPSGGPSGSAYHCCLCWSNSCCHFWISSSSSKGGEQRGKCACVHPGAAFRPIRM